MSSTKAALKAIGVAIHSQQYSDAVQQAEKLLAGDPKNYQAYTLLGFANDRLNKSTEAEKAYLAATTLKENESHAWQGLIKLYEKHGSDKLAAHEAAVFRLAKIFMDADEVAKCEELVLRFLNFAKNQGSRQQYINSLRIILPGPIYDFLEGRVPYPAQTFQTLAELTEAEENERINKEIGERRTRLGAKIDNVTIEVKREVLAGSHLDHFYSQIINWTRDDELRRHYEEKLLQRCFDSLLVLNADDQKQANARVQTLANDMVVIKHPFKLAWDVAIEWKDHESVGDWDVNVLREYCEFFPESGLAKVLQGFLPSEISTFPAKDVMDRVVSEDSEDDDEGGVGLLPTSPEDRLVLMVEGISDASGSLLAHRMLGEYYSFLEEYESLAELMRAGTKLARTQSEKTGMAFFHASQSLTSLLGTALVYFQSPRHHLEAKSLFDGILEQNPTYTSALLGVGLIYEEEEDFGSAIDFLDRALLRDPNNIRVRVEAAWAKALNGDYQSGQSQLEECLSSVPTADVKARELRAQIQYKIGICLWNIDPSIPARKDRSRAYASFLAALKSNMNLAPAYTSLGIFYADYAQDKKRARKCFQKAFELSASEVIAAERLAKAFADRNEWDLVEAVSQRVVDSGKTKPPPGSKKKGISWPYAALGVAELNKQEFGKSILSFQSALRISPDDYHSWVGLGESYYSCGRYMAALRTFQHTQQFEAEMERQHPGQTWFANYMTANVRRELGDHQAALDSYRNVLKSRPGEFVVSLGLIQTLSEAAVDSLAKGCYGQTSALATECLESALELASQRSDSFSLWKAAGDASLCFSWLMGRVCDFPSATAQKLLRVKHDRDTYSLFADFDGVHPEILTAEELWPTNEKGGIELMQGVQTGILCFKRAIRTTAMDVHSQAVAHFNLGLAELQAHNCIRPQFRAKTTRYIKAAIRCFKRAIELEAGNAEFWSALGVATYEWNPPVAQHCFVRSLYLNERNPQAWTNLGTLFLLHNDLLMANDAFLRAQCADPEYAPAWVGQGFLAAKFSDASEARFLFAHGDDISESPSAFIKRQHAVSTFDGMVAGWWSSDISNLVQPLFALDKLLTLSPVDPISQHLRALFFERSGDTRAAAAHLVLLCEQLEEEFDLSESPESISQFAMGKADLARLFLANGDLDGAIEAAQMSLDFSAEDAGNDMKPAVRKKCRLSANLTVGLAMYHQHKPDQAVAYFGAALQESNYDPDAVCLLAQVLWATGGTEARQTAQDRLFDSVDKNPGHVRSILLLGIIALLDGDTESLEAVTADLHNVRTDPKVSAVEQGQIGDILRAIAVFSSSDSVLPELQKDVLLFPQLPYAWSRLARATGDEYPADMALKMATRVIKDQTENDAELLAQTLTGTGWVSDAQKAIMVAPWLATGWTGLADGLRNEVDMST